MTDFKTNDPIVWQDWNYGTVPGVVWGYAKDWPKAKRLGITDQADAPPSEWIGVAMSNRPGVVMYVDPKRLRPYRETGASHVSALPEVEAAAVRRAAELLEKTMYADLDSPHAIGPTMLAMELREHGLLRYEESANTLPDVDGGCACTPHSQDAGGGYTEHLLEYEPACPEHSVHLYDPRAGKWVFRDGGEQKRLVHTIQRHSPKESELLENMADRLRTDGHNDLAELYYSLSRDVYTHNHHLMDLHSRAVTGSGMPSLDHGWEIAQWLVQQGWTPPEKGLRVNTVAVSPEVDTDDEELL
jgi:hypothetical protein